MKKMILVMVASAVVTAAAAQEFENVPKSWKWIGNEEVIFSFDGTFTDSTAFSINAHTGSRNDGVKAPESKALCGLEQHEAALL